MTSYLARCMDCEEIVEVKTNDHGCDQCWLCQWNNLHEVGYQADGDIYLDLQDGSFYNTRGDLIDSSLVRS